MKRELKIEAVHNPLDGYYDVICNDWGCQSPVDWSDDIIGAEESIELHEKWHNEGCPGDWDNYEMPGI